MKQNKNHTALHNDVMFTSPPCTPRNLCHSLRERGQAALSACSHSICSIQSRNHNEVFV